MAEHLDVVLGIAFITAGVIKLRPHASLRSGMPWVEDFTPSAVHAIAVLEITASILLFYAKFAGPAPSLTLGAAALLIALMLGAGYTHLRRGEFFSLVPVLALLVLAAAVAGSALSAP